MLALAACGAVGSTDVGRTLDAAADAFEASGTLLVASASSGSIVRITLSPAGTEAARQTVAAASAPDSIALDALGRIYFTSEFGGTLSRMNPDGGGLETLEPSLSSPFALDFGHGALSTCALLFVSGGLVRSRENDAPGAATLWHGVEPLGRGRARGSRGR